jgi:hypothetical protein
MQCGKRKEKEKELDEKKRQCKSAVSKKISVTARFLYLHGRN